MNERKTNWIEYLPPDVSSRLASCCNTKEDVPILVDARWRWIKENRPNEGFIKADAVVDVFEWLDSNSQYYLCDVSQEEYDELIRE